jgi:hypothetical protein
MEKINQLAQHKYYECSDLPFLGRIGIYSCHACDHWRGRALSRGFLKTSQRRDFLNDRFQCTRAKKGFGPIRVRIIYNGGRTSSDTLPASQITSKLAVENHLHQSSASRKKVSVKRKRAEEVVLRLQCTRKANIAKEYTAIIDKLEKDKRAMEIRRKLEDRKNMELKSQLEVKEMMKSMPSAEQKRSGLSITSNGISSGQSIDVIMLPIVQTPSGMDFVGRFLASPTPIPRPKTLRIAFMAD